MPVYLHPGVYVEEIPSGSKPIEGVGTSTAAFVGYTTKGPIGEPELILKWDDYVNKYGGIRDTEDPIGDHMGFSVSAFYQNGGSKAYIVRITKDWTNSTAASSDKGAKAVGAIDHPSASNTTDALLFTAVNEGTWANGLAIEVSSKDVPAGDDPLYTVEIGRKNDETPPEFFVEETFTNISLDENGSKFITKVINGFSELVTVEIKKLTDITAGTPSLKLGMSIGGDLSGLSLPLDLSSAAAEDRTLTIALDGSAAINRTIGQASYDTLADIAQAIQDEVTSGPGSTTSRQKYFTCEAQGNKLVLTSGTHTDSSAVVVQDSSLAKTLKLGEIYKGTSTSGDLSGLTFPFTLADDDASRTLTVTIDGGSAIDHIIPADTYNALSDIAANIDSIDGLTCAAVGNTLVLTSDDMSIPTSAVVITNSGVAATLNLGTANGGTEQNGAAYHAANGGEETTGSESSIDSYDLIVGPGETILGDGEDGKEPDTADYDAVFTKFLKIRDINIICLPGQNWPKDISSNPEGQPVIDAAIAHAVKMKSRMVIVDPPNGVELDTELKVKNLKLPNKTYSVLYYPWTKVANPFYNAEDNPGAEKTVLVPPCGFAAGMWAKIDGKRGVWKAPAGLETGLGGLAGLEWKVEDGEQDSLNPLGVNCLRSMPGPVIWGARTLATKADPEWRYVPVRRTAIMIEQSIYNGIQWAVFEPNDHRLWSALRGNIGGFMNSLFRVGAFQGEKASDAYFVRCGLGDTMTQTDIDAGQVIVIVGFAPLKPAEFVIVRIQQKVNQQ
ncbi:MAG: phage tail sheath family protein [Planctomycetota bacterium]|jgi:phage tail sheath protein FI